MCKEMTRGEGLVLLERTNDDAIARLETFAARFHPRQSVVVDEAVGDLVELHGMRASIATISLNPIGGRGIRESWRQLLQTSRERPWHVDLLCRARMWRKCAPL